MRSDRAGARNYPEYNVWKAMKRRCCNPKDRGFKYYGHRGVRVCRRWLDSFWDFLQDVGRRPSGEYSVDRFPDASGNYEPGSVRWATDTEQNRNRPEFNANVEFRGEIKTIAEWGDVLGLPVSILYWRIRQAGWSAERALTEPVRLGRHTPKGSPSEAALANMRLGQKRRWSAVRALEVK